MTKSTRTETTTNPKFDEGKETGGFVLVVKLNKRLQRKELKRLRGVYPTRTVQATSASGLMVTFIGTTEDATKLAQKYRKTKHVKSVAVSSVGKELWDDLIMAPLTVHTILTKVEITNPFQPALMLGDHYVTETVSALDRIYIEAGMIFSAPVEEFEELAREAGKSAQEGLSELRDFGYVTFDGDIFTPTKRYINRFK